MLKPERGIYTATDVLNAIHGRYGARTVKFRYDLLDNQNKKLGEIDTMENGEVSMASLSDIKRTARFSLRDKGDINFLSDRIQPYMLLKMNDGGFSEFPLGIFLPNSPTRADRNRNVYRDIDAFDGLIILKEDKFTSSYTVAQGMDYRTAVIDILETAGITAHNIEPTTKSLPKDITFEIGSEKINAVNSLLQAINYRPIHVDVYGFYTSMNYTPPSLMASEYLYKDDELSIIYSGITEELDLNVPNKWVVVRSNSELPPIYAEYTNNNPNSLTSTVNRGRSIVDVRTLENVADQDALNKYVERIAFESSQIYGKIEFETALNPLHDYNDVYTLEYSPLGISGKYSETSWTMPLKEGARMKHSVRKVVNI